MALQRKLAKKKRFITRFVIGIGFLQGLWMAIGIDPGELFFKGLYTIVHFFTNDALYLLVFAVLPTATMILTLFYTYKHGRLFGLMAVAIAVLAGLSILVSWKLSLVLLFISFMITMVMV